MTVAVTTLNPPPHQPSTAHKRQPNASPPAPNTSANSVPTAQPPPLSSSNQHPSHPSHPSPPPKSTSTSTRLFPPRRLPRSSRIYRLLILLVLIASLLFVVAQIPFRTLHFVISSFVPHLSPSSLRSYFYSLRRYGRTLLHSYQRQLHVRPLSSRAITAGIIFFIADTIAQILSRPRRKPFFSAFSFKRLARYSLYGLTFMGPLLYVWYDTMNRFGPPDDLHGSVMKSIFEEVTLEPLCISAYLVYDAICTGKPYRNISHTMRTRFWALWVNNCAFWVPANFANYYVGTPDMRVVFANLCSLFWNVYFSSKVNIPTPGLLRQNSNDHTADSPVLPLTVTDTPTSSAEAIPSNNTTRSRRTTGNASTTISVAALPRSPTQRNPSQPGGLGNSGKDLPPLSQSIGARPRPSNPTQQSEHARQPLHTETPTHANSLERNHFHVTPSPTTPSIPRLVTSSSLRP